jgi:predicted small secreted protein
LNFNKKFSIVPILNKELIMKKLFAILSLGLFVIGLSGCNTIKGVGQDVEKGGEKVQEVAKKVQNKM